MVKKEMIWGFYALMTVILGVIGYFIGKKQDEKWGGELIGTATGVVIGIIISVILWFTVGKKMSY